MNNLRLNWNEERWRTRDRLLEYDISIMPPAPHTGGIITPYPWENTTLSMLSHQLYQIAANNGFTGTEQDFLLKFSSNENEVVVGTIATFPIEGNTKYLYLDQETGILYYFKIFDEAIDASAAERIGAVMVSSTNVYIPVRAMLLENTILDCGDATEYID